MATAKSLATPGKGILASDESTGTIGNRFESIGVENTHENRIAYRSLLFHAPEIEKHISGAILYDETARDSDENGKKFVELLAEKGIIPKRLAKVKPPLCHSCLMGKQDKTCVENFACFTMDQKFESYSKIFTSEISQLDLEMFSV